jgi:hypothetical protein
MKARSIEERYPDEKELKRRAKRLVGLDEATTDRAQLEAAAEKARKEGKNETARFLLK